MVFSLLQLAMTEKSEEKLAPPSSDTLFPETDDLQDTEKKDWESYELPPPQDPSHFYEMSELETRRAEEFGNAIWMKFKLRFINVKLCPDFDAVVTEAFETLIHRAQEMGTWGGIVMRHPSLRNSIIVRPQPLKNMSADTIFSELFDAMGTDEVLTPDGGFFTAEVTALNL